MKTTDPRPTVPCLLCGQPTTMIFTKLCDPCWELSNRIRKNPEVARKVLAKVDEERKEFIV